MALKQIFSRLGAAAPAVEVGPALVEALQDRLAQAENRPEALADALRGVVAGELAPRAEAWREAVGLDEAELHAELYLCAWVACHTVLEAADRDPEAGMAEVRAALREYVGYGWRERYDERTSGVLKVARGLKRGDRDESYVVVAMQGRRLGLPGRSGAGEGWFRVGVVAWLAGEALGQRLLEADPGSDGV